MPTTCCSLPHLLVAEDGAVPLRAQGQGGLSTRPGHREQLGSLGVSAVTASVMGMSWVWPRSISVTRLRSPGCGCLHSDRTKPLAVHTTCASLAQTSCPQCTAAAEMGSSEPEGKSVYFTSVNNCCPCISSGRSPATRQLPDHTWI